MLALKKFIPCYATALCIKTHTALLAACIRLGEGVQRLEVASPRSHAAQGAGGQRLSVGQRGIWPHRTTVKESVQRLEQRGRVAFGGRELMQNVEVAPAVNHPCDGTTIRDRTRTMKSARLR
jgi:hypothetical protein